MTVAVGRAARHPRAERSGQDHVVQSDLRRFSSEPRQDMVLAAPKYRGCRRTGGRGLELAAPIRTRCSSTGSPCWTISIWRSGARPLAMLVLRPRPGDAQVAKRAGHAERVRLDHVVDDRSRPVARSAAPTGARHGVVIKPRLLMLDEPAAGLSPGDRPEFLRLLRDFPKPDLDPDRARHGCRPPGGRCRHGHARRCGRREQSPDRIGIDPIVRSIYFGRAR